MIAKLRELFFSQTERVSHQFIRYFVVSAIGLVVDFGVLVFATEVLNIHYLVSAILGFIFGLAVNYWLATLWVFTTRSLDNRLHEFLIFGAIGLVGLGINTVGLWLLTDALGLYYVLSKVFVTGFVFIWNFAARRFVLFGGR